MSDKLLRIAITLGLVLAGGLALLQGCGEITGNFEANQLPEVEIVNVPQDAYGVDTTQHYGMPFQAVLDQPVVILSMQGATMMENSETVYAVSPANPFEPGEDYTMDYAAGTLTALSSGSMVPDSTYYIDFSFLIENYYVFTFAPTIHWVGFDPDGFIDHYSYADVSDAQFVAGFRDAQEQGDEASYFAANQNQVVWYDTTAMQARIYLLTTEGDTTEHLFFVRATDNMGAESQSLVYKTFYRSNNAPNNPQIKPLDRPDADFAQNYVVQDTLFCLDNLTPLWQGISFNWKSDDPDDKELYQIPLEFTYYLIKTPGDTIGTWSNPNWTEASQIQIFGLETGSYALVVWCRDDGYTPSAEPASITFNVVRPTLQYHILLVDETMNSGNFEVPGDSVNAFWQDLLQSLEGQLENDNYVMDGVDVRYLDNSSSIDKANSPLPYSLIGQYKLLIIYDDDHTATNYTYIENRGAALEDYLDVGGRVWVEGRRVTQGFHTNTGDAYASSQESSVGGSDLLGEYIQFESVFVAPEFPTGLGTKTEFKGALPVLEELPPLEVDSNKVKLIPGLPPTQNVSLLGEVDWFTRAEASISLYTFNSVTADTIATSPYVYSEDSPVASDATPTQCKVNPLKQPLLAVYQVENVTKGVVGQIVSFNTTQITVSYPYGEPWSNSDILEVDYKYDPISQMHLKPVAVRYEAQPRVLTTIEINGQTFSYYTYSLGYRTSLFTFPLFFIQNDQGQVEDLTREMLNWFFYPTIHWTF